MPISILVTFLLLALLFSGVFFILKKAKPSSDFSANLSLKYDSHQALSILPFESLSGDVGDDFFASGITLDVISLVSKVPNIRVSSRFTSFRFKQGNADLARIAKQANTRYVVVGSVALDGDQITVMAKLMDVHSDVKIWSQTYQRNIDELFEVENNIAECIVAEILGEVKLANAWAANDQPNQNLDAWGLEQKAYHFWLTSFSPEGVLQACNYLRQALEIDSSASTARAALAMLLVQQMTARSTDDYEDCAKEASALIEQAVQEAPDNIDVLENAGVVWQNLGESQKSERALRKAIELAPFNLIARGYLALLLAFTGAYRGAIEAKEIVNQNFAIAPNHPSTGYWRFFLAVAELRLGHYDEAIKLTESSLLYQPEWTHSYFFMANAHAEQGDVELAKKAIEKAHSVNPYLIVQLHAENVRKITNDQANVDAFIGGLVKQNLIT